MAQAILLISHGSRSPKSRQEIDALAARLSARSSGTIFESAFLELEQPSVAEGLEECVRRGATNITVLLNFLNSGRHVLEDIPRIVGEFESSHAGISCKITPCLGLHPKIDDLYLDLIR